MSDLYVFGDEFGTMPTVEGQGVFLAATVSVCGELPGIRHFDGHRSSLLKQLDEFEAFPFVGYVIPESGYGSQFEAKFQRMNLMARASRLVNGSNSHYLNPEGLRPRNMVWSYCMVTALAGAVAKMVFRESVQTIRVHLDQKSMSRADRALFNGTIARLVPNLRSLLAEAGSEPTARSALQAIQDCREATVTWSDEIECPSLKTGLALADSLARHSGKSIKRGAEGAHLMWLRSPKWETSSMNMTKLVLRPLQMRTISQWKTQTGLPEPSEGWK